MDSVGNGKKKKREKDKLAKLLWVQKTFFHKPTTVYLSA